MSFPAYPDYADSGVPWLGEIPSHWHRITIKRMTDPQRPITYGIVQAGPDLPGGIPYIRPADMLDEAGVRKPDEILRTSPEIASAYRRSEIKTGDIVCSIGPSFGKVMIVPDWLDGANLTQGTARLASNTNTSTTFLFWVLRSGPSVAQWESSIGGATFRALNLHPLANTFCSLPPLDEQQAIAAFLDREIAKIDALVAEQERLIALLKEKRQAVISHAVTKGLDHDAPMKDSGIEWLGEIPAHWTQCKLKHVVAKADGIQMGPFGGMLTNLLAEPTGYKVYGQENTISGDFDRGARWLSSEQFAELQRYQLRPGDLVLTRKGSLGGCRIVPNDVLPGIADSDTIRLRLAKARIEPQFFVYLLKDAHFIATQTDLNKRGAILAGINTSVVANTVVALPPLEEQNEIISFLNEFDLEMEALFREIDESISLLQERRAALISAAVTGKIDVRSLVEQHEMQAA